MSREAPLREALHEAPTSPAHEGPRHSALWLALPLLGWALFPLYRLATGTRARQLLRLDFTETSLGLAWWLVSVVSALLLVALMAARRKGRALWVAFDVLAGSLPWVVSLAAQSLTSTQPHGWLDEGGGPWGGPRPIDHVVLTLRMHEARGLGALMSGALWTTAALSQLLPHADKPRVRGAGLVVVALPLWGIVHGFPSQARALPALAAGLLTLVVAWAGTQRSEHARQGARDATVLATLAVLALFTSALCLTLVDELVVLRENYIAQHGALFALVNAARLGAIVALLPAALAARWLTRAGDPSVPRGATLALALAFVGVLALDRVGTRVALSRVAPEPWPPWAGLRVQPLPLADGSPTHDDPTPARFVLAGGALRDARGEVVAALSDTPAMTEALRTVVHALHQPTAPGAPLGERLAIAAARAAVAAPVCPGRSVSVLLDRDLSMAELRAFVRAATVADVAEITIAGPLALSPAEKRQLADALRATGQEAAVPLDGGDERAYTSALQALPALGIAALDALREDVREITVVTPTACWQSELLGEQGQPLGEPPQPLGERLNEAMPDYYQEHDLPGRPTIAWLDPSRDVASFLLEASESASAAGRVLWTLEPPAP